MLGHYGLGVDAGTTKLCVIAGGEAVEIHSGFPTTASIVRIPTDGSFTIPARGQLSGPYTPHLTLCKRLIGRPLTDGRLRHDIKLIPHSALDEHGPYYKAGERRFELVEVWGYILGRAKRAADRKYGGMPPENAVLTVPAYYRITQCEAIRSAAEIAGFDMKSTALVTEPVAITVDQIELDMEHDEAKYPNKSHIVVVDMGGGTSDINEVYFETSNGQHTYVIQAIEGDNFLGGADFDQCLLALAVNKAKTIGRGYELDMEKLLLACEIAKEDLTSAAAATIELPATNHAGPPDSITITRNEFDKECKPLIARFSKLIDRLPIVKASKAPTAVLLAGGASQMQWVKELCAKKFPMAKIEPIQGAAIAVARGACRIAESKHIIIQNVLSKSIGIEAFISDPSPEDKDRRRLATQQIANRNMRVPAQVTYSLETSRENQSEVELTFVEGESLEPGLNTRIDELTISGIPNCKKGTDIRVTLTINGPGDFNVKATIKDLTSELTVVPQRFLDTISMDIYKEATLRRLNGEAVQSRELLLGGKSIQECSTSCSTDEDAASVQETAGCDSNDSHTSDGVAESPSDAFASNDAATSLDKIGATEREKAPVPHRRKKLIKTAGAPRGKKRGLNIYQGRRKSLKRLRTKQRSGVPTRLS